MTDHKDDEHDNTPAADDERLHFGDAPGDDDEQVSPALSAAPDDEDEPIEHDMFSRRDVSEKNEDDEDLAPAPAAPKRVKAAPIEEEPAAEDIVLGEDDEADEAPEPLAAPRRRVESDDAPAAAPHAAPAGGGGDG